MNESNPHVELHAVPQITRASGNTVSPLPVDGLDSETKQFLLSVQSDIEAVVWHAVDALKASAFVESSLSAFYFGDYCTTDTEDRSAWAIVGIHSEAGLSASFLVSAIEKEETHSVSIEDENGVLFAGETPLAPNDGVLLRKLVDSALSQFRRGSVNRPAGS